MKPIKYVTVESVVANALMYAYQKTKGKVNSINLYLVKDYIKELSAKVEQKYNCVVEISPNQYAFDNFFIKNYEFYQITDNKIVLKKLPNFDINTKLDYPLPKEFLEFVKDLSLMKSFVPQNLKNDMELN